jgi:hypothetical protein
MTQDAFRDCVRRQNARMAGLEHPVGVYPVVDWRSVDMLGFRLPLVSQSRLTPKPQHLVGFSVLPMRGRSAAHIGVLRNHDLFLLSRSCASTFSRFLWLIRNHNSDPNAKGPVWRLPRRALALVREWARIHIEELNQNWELARSGQPAANCPAGVIHGAPRSPSHQKRRGLWTPLSPACLLGWS